MSGDSLIEDRKLLSYRVLVVYRVSSDVMNIVLMNREPDKVWYKDNGIGPRSVRIYRNPDQNFYNKLKRGKGHQKRILKDIEEGIKRQCTIESIIGAVILSKSKMSRAA